MIPIVREVSMTTRIAMILSFCYTCGHNSHHYFTYLSSPPRASRIGCKPVALVYSSTGCTGWISQGGEEERESVKRKKERENGKE